jgi:hypothetical protein
MPESAGCSLALLTANPLAMCFLGGQVFQVASIPAFPIGGEQRLTDQFFPTLMHRAGNPTDLILASPAREALDRVLAGQFNPLTGTGESQDSLNWEEVGGDLDWQGIEEAGLFLGRRRQREMLQQSGREAVVVQDVLDEGGLDQCFAEMAAVMDPSTHDE